MKELLNKAIFKGNVQELYESYTKIPKIKGVYIFECLVNGKIYVGSSVDKREGIRRRFRDHIYGFKRKKYINLNSPLYLSMKKHGLENFKFYIIEEANNGIEREQFYLDQLKPWDRKIGYNLAKNSQASQLGVVRSKKTIEKWKKSRGKYKLTEEHKRRISESNKGRIVTEETREKLKNIHGSSEYKKRSREKSLGRKHDEKSIEKMRDNRPNSTQVYQIDIFTGKIIYTYRSIGEAARRTNSHVTAIHLCVQGKISVSNGFVWKYVDDESPIKIPKFYTLIDTEGNKYETYNLAEFAREHNLNVSTLNSVVNGRKKRCKGWTSDVDYNPITRKPAKRMKWICECCKKEQDTTVDSFKAKKTNLCLVCSGAKTKRLNRGLI